MTYVTTKSVRGMTQEELHNKSVYDVTKMSVLQLLVYWEIVGENRGMPFHDWTDKRRSIHDELERRIGANRVEPTCDGKGCQR